MLKINFLLKSFEFLFNVKVPTCSIDTVMVIMRADREDFVDVTEVLNQMTTSFNQMILA